MPETLEVENEKFEVKGDGWDWTRIEAENKKGLKYAEHFTALDGLHKEFKIKGLKSLLNNKVKRKVFKVIIK